MQVGYFTAHCLASMKAPPKRKGNRTVDGHRRFDDLASMKVYTSSSRTNGPAVILDYHNSLVS